jgi:hypothetical protein
MKHLFNDISKSEKNRILEMHGVKRVLIEDEEKKSDKADPKLDEIDNYLKGKNYNKTKNGYITRWEKTQGSLEKGKTKYEIEHDGDPKGSWRSSNGKSGTGAYISICIGKVECDKVFDTIGMSDFSMEKFKKMIDV